MTLLDKNGKPYKLFSAPNPLVKDQVFLPKDKLLFHNMKFKPEIVNLKEEKLVKKEEIVNKLPEIIEQQSIIEEIKFEQKELPNNSDDQLNDKEIPEEEIIITYCHPLLTKEINDNLYGDIKLKSYFGDKFVFEAYIVESNDLEICLYTKKQGITINSILYPSKYKNGNPLKMLRWWKVKTIKQQDDEFLIFAEITSEQRSF